MLGLYEGQNLRNFYFNFFAMDHFKQLKLSKKKLEGSIDTYTSQLPTRIKSFKLKYQILRKQRFTQFALPQGKIGFVKDFILFDRTLDV